MNDCIHQVRKDAELSYRLLALAHSQEFEAVASKARPLCQLHEVTGGVRAGAQDEHDGGVGSALLIDGIETDDWRLHIPGCKNKMINNVITYENLQ